MNHLRMFFRYVLPSVIAFALSGVYTIIDGFFIGNKLGDMGLASVTIGFPIAAFLMAIGTGIGISGAIRFAILRGEKKGNEAKVCFSCTFCLLVFVSMVLTILTLLFLTPLLGILGAEGDILPMTYDYVKVIALGAVFQILATGLVPFIRNLGGATFAMVSMIAGFMTNILLDYLFIWLLNWGMPGAAWATVIGQGVTFLLAVFYLWIKKIGFPIPSVKRVIYYFGIISKIAFAPFGLTFSPQITTILMNRFLMEYGGDQSVAVYGCIDYVILIVYMLLQGVGDGSQPLISKNFSENNLQTMKQMRRFAYGTSLVISAVSILVLFFTRHSLGLIFGASPETNGDVSKYLPLFLATLLFLAYVRITTSYLYATEQSGLSYLLAYGEPALILLFLLVLPSIPSLGILGIWLAVPMAQVGTWVLSLIGKRLGDREISLYGL
jgi:putative MATE family efflux protein